MPRHMPDEFDFAKLSDGRPTRTDERGFLVSAPNLSKQKRRFRKWFARFPGHVVFAN